MPNFDGKGPAGAGPKTGKTQGPCTDGAANAPAKNPGITKNQEPGKGNGKGNPHGKNKGKGAPKNS